MVSNKLAKLIARTFYDTIENRDDATKRLDQMYTVIELAIMYSQADNFEGELSEKDCAYLQEFLDGLDASKQVDVVY